MLWDGRTATDWSEGSTETDGGKRNGSRVWESRTIGILGGGHRFGSH